MGIVFTLCSEKYQESVRKKFLKWNEKRGLCPRYWVNENNSAVLKQKTELNVEWPEYDMDMFFAVTEFNDSESVEKAIECAKIFRNTDKKEGTALSFCITLSKNFTNPVKTKISEVFDKIIFVDEEEDLFKPVEILSIRFGEGSYINVDYADVVWFLKDMKELHFAKEIHANKTKENYVLNLAEKIRANTTVNRNNLNIMLHFDMVDNLLDLNEIDFTLTSFDEKYGIAKWNDIFVTGYIEEESSENGIYALYGTKAEKTEG